MASIRPPRASAAAAASSASSLAAAPFMARNTPPTFTSGRHSSHRTFSRATARDTAAYAPGLRPVLSARARVESVHTLSPGEHAGYGLAFTARRPTRLAAVAIGYADGVPRELSRGRGSLLVRGVRTPYEGMPLLLVLDGQVQAAALGACGRDEAWLLSHLREMGFAGAQELLLCSLDTQGELFAQARGGGPRRLRAMEPQEVRW